MQLCFLCTQVSLLCLPAGKYVLDLAHPASAIIVSHLQQLAASTADAVAQVRLKESSCIVMASVL
jgi:hypothetical protein